MSRSMNQHAFTDFTGKPYIYYQGVPYEQNNNCCNKKEYPFRTIVRTITSNGNIVNHVPLNGLGRLQAISNFTANNTTCKVPDTWANCARKDNMFISYTKNSNYGANNLYT